MKTQPIRALPTVFDGIEFRSRLEARWSAFFKDLGVVHEYEYQGFATDGDAYLPDFWLPGLQLWAEVKPAPDSDPDGIRRWRKFIEARNQERGVLLTSMHSGPLKFLLIGPSADEGPPWEADQAEWLCCPGGYHFDVQPYPQAGCSSCKIEVGYWHESARVSAAFDRARSYRFDRR